MSIVTSRIVALLAFAIAVPGAKAQQQADVRVPASMLERYVGEYQHPSGSTIMIRLRGDTLIQEGSTRVNMLRPISETKFMLGPVFSVEFVMDQAGKVTHFLTTDGVDIETRLLRKGADAPAPLAPPAPARVPRSVLERYVGVYEYLPGQMRRADLRVVVQLRGDTLIRYMGGEAVLVPISETRFRVGDTSLVVEFVVDEFGVTQVLGSGFQQMLARLTSKR